MSRSSINKIVYYGIFVTCTVTTLLVAGYLQLNKEDDASENGRAESQLADCSESKLVQPDCHDDGKPNDPIANGEEEQETKANLINVDESVSVVQLSTVVEDEDYPVPAVERNKKIPRQPNLTISGHR